jgi:DnaJ-class molecular chaperone
MKDPYKVLGVSKSTSQADLKKKYRQLAMKLHPDQNPGDDKVAEQFKEVSAAYSLLSDEQMKARYDRGEINADGSEKGFSGYQRQQAGGGNPFGGGGFGVGGNPFGSGFDAEDLFSSIFGGAAARGGARASRARSAVKKRGQDKIYTINIDFLDAVLGSKKQIKLENGKTLNVKTPENVKEGQQIRLKGQGRSGVGGGANGDALIEVNTKKHPYFTRNNNDIVMDLPITLEEAIMGSKVTVPTVNGKIALNIPKNSNSGKTMRLKGRGATDPKSKKKGDQLVKLMVMLPSGKNSDLEKSVKKWSTKLKDTEVKNIRGHFD